MRDSGDRDLLSDDDERYPPFEELVVCRLHDSRARELERASDEVCAEVDESGTPMSALGFDSTMGR